MRELGSENLSLRFGGLLSHGGGSPLVQSGRPALRYPSTKWSHVAWSRKGC